MSDTKCESPNVHHCPIKGCLYAFGSQRYFTNKRLLNQHKGKVHAEKKYTCSKCQKGFGIDWLKKNHELQCGKIWECSCGQTYTSRECLLSHARRKDHQLSDEVKITPRIHLVKNQKKPAAVPVVFVIQPVIQQHIALVLPSAWHTESNNNNKHSKRKILPKQTVPPIFINPTPQTMVCNLNQDSLNVVNTNNLDKFESFSRIRHNKCTKVERKQKGRLKTVAETQTCDELKSAKSLRKLESRGSQCYSKMMKQQVGIESTCTQTMEIASRSRRKSVAVVTDSDIVGPTQSLWSQFEEYLRPSEPVKSATKVNRTSSTQTMPASNCSINSKIMCDSQTLTDDGMFPFIWTLDRNTLIEEDSSIKNMSGLLSSDKMLLEKIPSNDSEFGNFNLWDSESKREEQSNTMLKSMLSTSNANPSGSTATHDKAIHHIHSIFDTIIDSVENFEGESESPLQSHIQTQTTSPLMSDYSSLLANMETQTTGDFALSDLEFFDIETQTLWEDIPSFSEELRADQFSTESQTDFSTLCSFVVNSNLAYPAPTLGKHMETQTPQLTNSEAQTLIASPYSFSST